LAILSISAICCAMPFWKAGAKSESLMRSKGGAWNGKVLGASNGLPAVGAAPAAQTADTEQMASAATAPSKTVRFPSIKFPTFFEGANMA